MLKKKDTGFAVFSPFKSGRTKMLVNDIVKNIGFIIPLNQVGLKIKKKSQFLQHVLLSL